MAITIESLSVRLNLNRSEDRKIYDKLQDYPKGDRSKIIKEALLQYLNGVEGEKGAGTKVKESTRILRVKEASNPLAVGSHEEEHVPAQDAKDVPIIEKEGDKSEDARSRLKKMVY